MAGTPRALPVPPWPLVASLDHGITGKRRKGQVAMTARQRCRKPQISGVAGVFW